METIAVVRTDNNGKAHVFEMVKPNSMAWAVEAQAYNMFRVVYLKVVPRNGPVSFEEYSATRAFSYTGHALRQWGAWDEHWSLGAYEPDYPMVDTIEDALAICLRTQSALHPEVTDHIPNLGMHMEGVTGDHMRQLMEQYPDTSDVGRMLKKYREQTDWNWNVPSSVLNHNIEYTLVP